MEENERTLVSVGKFHIDAKGAGRIYLKKKITDTLLELGFKHGEEVRVEVDIMGKKVVISKL